MSNVCLCLVSKNKDTINEKSFEWKEFFLSDLYTIANVKPAPLLDDDTKEFYHPNQLSILRDAAFQSRVLIFD